MGSVTTDDLQADTLSDKAGSGAPDAPNGLAIEGVALPTSVSEVILASDFTTSGTNDVASMNVTVVIGKTYLVLLQSCLMLDSADTTVNLQARDGSGGPRICKTSWSNPDLTTDLFLVAGAFGIYTATDTTLTVEATLQSANSAICGNSGAPKNETFIQVKELGI